MSQEIKPTRMELIKLKKRIALAQSGYNLLKKKRDGLILEFFEVLKKAKSLRQDLTVAYQKALAAMNIARTIEGDIKIRSLARAVKDKPLIELSAKNIMGVSVPKINAQYSEKHFLERGYGLTSSSAALDSAAHSFDVVVIKVIEAAEVETALKKLLIEIEKTKRRVNALEFEVIPKLKKQKAFIQMRLEEMERENIFRMKRIK